MNRPHKRKQDEENEALDQALRTFEDEFGGVIPPPSSKAFIRGDVVENNRTISGASGKLYKPEPKISLKLGGLPSSAPSFEEAKKLAAEKARRMLAEAHKGNGPTPTVVAPHTSKPIPKPAKPGTNRNQRSKTTNLDAFKEELKRVQQERDKRKGLRDHLRNELGVDPAAVDRIAPVLDKPYAGNGEFDDDPYTTNLYICNLPQDVVMEDILDTFGSFGPLASAKVLYPRTEEEKRREHLCGFVAYMSRVDADRAIAALQHGLEINGDPVKMSFARPVVMPPQPFYVPPGLQELTVPDPPTGLPFNAKPLEKDITEWKDKYGELPPLGPPLPDDWSADRLNAYNEMIKNATVRVVIPTDSSLLHIIHRTIEFVIREGPIFEAMLMGRESHNPLYRFLFDTHHPAHVYYRWKLFSILQGDRLDKWRLLKFRMFVNGSWWEPPPPIGELLKAMPPSLYYLACNVLNAEKWFPTLTQKKTIRESRFVREKKEIIMRAEQERKRKIALNKADFKELDTMLRQLTPEREKIGDAMLWCAEHASCAQEVVETLYESLTIDETPLHKKIARLYLISDILANCAQRGVKDMFSYRQYFQDYLNKIFGALGDTLQKIEGRLKAEQFKTRVMECFRVWEETALYPREVLIHNQNIFLGLVEREKDTSSSSEDEDIDGAPIEEDDIDGIPLDENIYHDVKVEELIEEPPRKKAAFKPASWDEVPSSELSKWERNEDNAPSASGNKWDDVDKSHRQQSAVRNENIESKRSGSDSEGEIDDKDSPTTIRVNTVFEEARRKLLREVEVKVLTYQEELQIEKDPDIRRKVEEHRRKLMSEVDTKLEEKLKKDKKKDKKRDKKDKKRESSKENPDRKERDRERERDKRKEREEDHGRNRERPKESSKRDRDRSRERRDRSRDRYRRRSNSRDREYRRDRSRSSDRRRR